MDEKSQQMENHNGWNWGWKIADEMPNKLELELKLEWKLGFINFISLVGLNTKKIILMTQIRI